MSIALSWSVSYRVYSFVASSDYCCHSGELSLVVVKHWAPSFSSSGGSHCLVIRTFSGARCRSAGNWQHLLETPSCPLFIFLAAIFRWHLLCNLANCYWGQQGKHYEISIPLATFLFVSRLGRGTWWSPVCPLRPCICSSPVLVLQDIRCCRGAL